MTSASGVSGFALSYDVVPLARVETLRVEHQYNDAIVAAPFEVTENCPSSVTQTAWAGHGATNDVVRSRIVLGATRSASRSAWLSFPVGPHTLTLDVSAIPAGERTGAFYVVYTPTWGATRIALVPVVLTPGSGDELEVSGLPDGEGHVAVVRTPLVRRIGEHAAYEAPPGFMTQWAVASELWYGATVATGQTADVVLERYRSAADVAAFGRISTEETLAYTSGTQVRFASFGPGISDGSIAIDCDGVTTIDVPFRAVLDLTVDGGTVSVETGGSVNLDPVCSGAGTSALVNLHVVSQTHSGWLVIRNP